MTDIAHGPWQQQVSDYYAGLLAQHGVSHAAVDAGSQASLRLRYDVIRKGIKPFIENGGSLLDVGCGYGAFYDYLIEHGFYAVRYMGIDICASMVTEAKERRPNIVFLEADILTWLSVGVTPKFHAVIASGLFQLEASRPHWTNLIEQMWTCTKGILAFNMLSRHADSKEPHEAYYWPDDVLQFARKLTPFCKIDHTYRKNDFTVFMYREQQTA